FSCRMAHKSDDRGTPNTQLMHKQLESAKWAIEMSILRKKHGESEKEIDALKKRIIDLEGDKSSTTNVFDVRRMKEIESPAPPPVDSTSLIKKVKDLENMLQVELENIKVCEESVKAWIERLSE
ncbi:hypothetical protein PFISCL1PPCAC_20118, partial [Pristionchus fissidentatus]